jgi:hypothetical protein
VSHSAPFLFTTELHHHTLHLHLSHLADALIQSDLLLDVVTLSQLYHVCLCCSRYITMFSYALVCGLCVPNWVVSVHPCETVCVFLFTQRRQQSRLCRPSSCSWRGPGWLMTSMIRSPTDLVL